MAKLQPSFLGGKGGGSGNAPPPIAITKCPTAYAAPSSASICPEHKEAIKIYHEAQEERRREQRPRFVFYNHRKRKHGNPR